MKAMLAFAVLATSLLWAADKRQPLNIKVGLWESSASSASSGPPPIPQEMLDKMPEAQRSQIEQAMKSRGGASPTAMTHKYCLTKEKLEKDLSFGGQRGTCTNEIVSSSPSGAEVKFHCVDKEAITDGTAKFQAVNSENVKGTIHAVTSSSGHTMATDLAITSRYLGPSCGEVK